MKTGYKVWFTIYLVFLALGSFSQKPTASENELRKQADKHFSSANFIQATPLYSQLLSLFPHDPVLNYRYGVSMVEAGKEKSQAVVYLEFAVKNPPIPEDAWLYLGKARMMANDFSKAAEALSKFKNSTSASRIQKQEAELLLSNCKSAELISQARKNIFVENSQEVRRSNFYSGYDFSEASGKIVPTADQFLTTLDKDKQVNPVMFISRDGQLVFYSSYGRGTSAGKDLYRVRKMTNGQWGVPENLGQVVNSAEHEDYPYLDRDGRTLYFCSRGHNSIGGYDIFKTVYDYNTSQWSVPENLGIPINTAADEFLYVPNLTGDKAVYSTSYESNPGELVRKTILIDGINNRFALISGTYYSLDQATRRDARVTVLRAFDRAVVNSVRTDPKSGRYELVLPPGEEYILLVEGGGYMPHAEQFSVPDLAVSGMRQEVRLNKDKLKEQMTVSNYFTPVHVKKGESQLAFKDTPTEVSTSVIQSNEENTEGKIQVLIDNQLVYINDPSQKNDLNQSSLPAKASGTADYGYKGELNDGSQDTNDEEILSKRNPTGLKTAERDRYDPTLEARFSSDELRQMEEERERALIIEEEERNPNILVDITIDNAELAQIALEDAESLQEESDRMKASAEALKMRAALQDSLALTLDEELESVAKSDATRREAIRSRSADLKNESLNLNRQATSMLLQASIKMDESRAARRDAEAILRSTGKGSDLALRTEKTSSAQKSESKNTGQSEVDTDPLSTIDPVSEEIVRVENEVSINTPDAIAQESTEIPLTLQASEVQESNTQPNIAKAGESKNNENPLEDSQSRHDITLRNETDQAESKSEGTSNIATQISQVNSMNSSLQTKTSEKEIEVQSNERNNESLAITDIPSAASKDILLTEQSGEPTVENRISEDDTLVSDESALVNSEQESISNNEETINTPYGVNLTDPGIISVNESNAETTLPESGTETNVTDNTIAETGINVETEKVKISGQESIVSIPEELSDAPSTSPESSDIKEQVADLRPTTSESNVSIKTTAPSKTGEEPLQSTSEQFIAESKDENSSAPSEADIVKIQSGESTPVIPTKPDQVTGSSVVTTNSVNQETNINYNPTMDSGRIKFTIPEAAKPTLNPEAKIVYESYEKNIQASETLFRQSRTLQERVLEMPRSPERDSLLQVANALSRESGSQYNMAISQLQDATAIDPGLSALLVQRENVVDQEIQAIAKETTPELSDESTVERDKSVTDFQYTESMTTSNTESITRSSSDARIAASTVSEVQKTKPESSTSDILNQENSKESELPVEQNKSAVTSGYPSSEGGDGLLAVEKKADHTESITAPETFSENTRSEELKSKGKEQGEIMEGSSIPVKPTALEIKDGLDVNHPKYAELEVVQTKITDSQVETINLFAEGVNLNKQAVEKKNLQVSLLDSAQQQTDETQKSSLLQEAELLGLESEKYQQESKDKFAQSQRKTGDVKSLTREMELIRSEILSDTKQKQTSLANNSIEIIRPDNSDSAIPDREGNIVTSSSSDLFSRTESRDNTSIETANVNSLSKDEIASFSVERFSVSRGPAYTSVNPIPLNPGLPEGLIFKVQIGAFRKPIPDDSFKNLQPISAETTRPGWLRYCVGLFKTFEPANLVKKQLRSTGYKDAFVVAYFNGQRISLAEANALLNRQEYQTAYAGEMQKEIAALRQLNVIPSVQRNAVRDTDEILFYGNAPSPDIESAITSTILEYAVQVGVYRYAQPPAILSSLEPIYTERMTSGLFRFTSGRFENRSDAEVAKQKAIQAGVSDAFIVAFNGNVKTQVPHASAVSQTTLSTSTENRTVSGTTLSGVNAPRALQFRVQLGAFRQNVPFETVEAFLRISDKGIERITDERGLNIFYAGDFTGYEEANRLKEEVVQKGVSDAFVVVLREGKRIPLSSVMPVSE